MQDFLVACDNNVGTKKKNQDSLVIEIADTDMGPILFAAICDGMGGLSAGEKASGKLARYLGKWFEEELAPYISGNKAMISAEAFEEDMNRLIQKTGKEIYENSREESGTTITGLLLGTGFYYTVNVGDTRAYRLQDDLVQLTKDQTVVQQEIDEGKITEEEALTHPQRSVLLQCVGASEDIVPEFTSGKYMPEDVFLLCSDGFRHVLKKDEIQAHMNAARSMTEPQMEEMLKELTNINLSRGEKDNITSVIIRVIDRGRF